MTQRSILAGETPLVIIRVGSDVTVEGWDSDRVQAETDSRSGLNVGRRSATEVGRVRAKVGERVLLDVGLDIGAFKKKEEHGEAIEVQMGAGGKVWVPRGSRLKVYAGRNVEVRDVQGNTEIVAGRDALTRNIGSLSHASAGRTMDLEFDTVEGSEVKFSAGRDLRFYPRASLGATLIVNDMGGRWEAVLGDGRLRIRLNAGGDATLVTAQDVTGQPPDYTVGNVDRPPAPGGEAH